MNYQSLILLVVFIAAMYFMMIRPQRKKDKQIQEMRNSLQVGDEIVTIGGICGKIVKTKNESIVIQVGADKVKFEMMRWSVSSVVSKSSKAKAEDDTADETPKKAKPKRLKKTADVEEGAEEAKEEAPKKEAAKADKADKADKAEAPKEEAASDAPAEDAKEEK